MNNKNLPKKINDQKTLELTKIIDHLNNNTPINDEDYKDIKQYVDKLKKVRDIVDELKANQVTSVQVNKLALLEEIDKILLSPVYDDFGEIKTDPSGAIIRKIDTLSGKELVNLVKAQAQAVSLIQNANKKNVDFGMGNTFVVGDNNKNQILVGMTPDERYSLKEILYKLIEKVSNE